MENSSVAGVKINIRKAVIRSIEFSGLDKKGVPKVSVTVDLLTASNAYVSGVTLATDSWNDATKLPTTEIDPFVYANLGDIVQSLIGVCIRKINGIEKVLEDKR